MIAVPVRHFILFKESGQVTPTSPAFPALLHNNDLWWKTKGLDLEFPTDPEVMVGHQINLAQQNPWPQTAAWWQSQPDYDQEVSCVVFLAGWSDGWYIGWGGQLGVETGGLSVVGDYALQRINSLPTTPDDPTDPEDPASLVDDWVAGQLVLHEEGHALGLPHDFVTPGSAMSYDWWYGYNSILSQQQREELTARLASYQQEPTTMSREWRQVAMGKHRIVVEACLQPQQTHR